MSRRPPPASPGGALDAGPRRALRLVPDLGAPELEVGGGASARVSAAATLGGGVAAHPLTTTSTPLLPSREMAGGAVDIWEEMDRAAVWVHDEACAGRLTLDGRAVASGAGQEQLRHSLRLVCVATRSAWAALDRTDSRQIIRREDVPGPIPPAALVRALRQRLVAQTVAARDHGAPAAAPDDVLRALAALDRVDDALAGDGVRSVVAQLRGATAMELLVEVAHDMRSPLGSILFLVERLRGGAIARAASEDRQLALVYGAAFGLSAMVSDVMELARGGDRLAAGEPGPFVVTEVVDAVRSIVAPLAEERGLVLDVSAPPRDVRIGHGAALHRVLVNLVTNALKFTPSGEVTMRVDARSRERLAFTIRDTGRGIPANVLAQLFQTFRRRATGDDYAFSSAGLGLAICQKLLGAMGSALEVESAEGRGTTFRFELDLPLAER